jgi:hypothetical protein
LHRPWETHNVAAKELARLRESLQQLAKQPEPSQFAAKFRRNERIVSSDSQWCNQEMKESYKQERYRDPIKNSLLRKTFRFDYFAQNLNCATFSKPLLQICRRVFVAYLLLFDREEKKGAADV